MRTTKWTEWLKKLLRGTYGLKILVGLGMTGLLCLLWSGMTEHTPEESAEVQIQETEAELAAEAEQYAAALEERLEGILSRMDGVGRCEVMLTVRSGTAYAYVQDVQQSSAGENLSYERNCVRLDTGSGETPLVERVVYPEITGVLVVCEGGESNVVKEQIHGAVHAVLNVPANQICVTKMHPKAQ